MILRSILPGGTATQGSIYTGRIHHLRKQLGHSTLGQSQSRRGQDSRGGALAACNRRGGWNLGQNQMRNVGLVFARCALGVLCPESHFFRYSSRKWGQTGTEHRRADKCQAPEFAARSFPRASETGFRQTRISRTASRVSRRSPGHSAGRIGSTALAGLRFRKDELQRSAFVLLAPWRKPEEYKDGGLGKTVADASDLVGSFAGVALAEPLQQRRRLRLPFGKAQRQETSGSRFGVKEENPAWLQVGWHIRGGLAHISALSRNHAGRNGRASADHPRLPAAQQSSCHEQVLAGDIEDETFGPGKAGRGNYACGRARAKTSRPMIVDGGNNPGRKLVAYRPLTSPDLGLMRVASA